MLVLHGLLGSHQNFRNIVKNEAIANFVNPFLLDARNHGDSEHSNLMTYQDLA